MTRFLMLVLLAIPTLADTKPAEVVTSLYVAPQLQFKLVSGKLLPKDVLTCDVSKEHLTFAEHADSYIRLDCNDEVVLKLDNVIFAPGKVFVKVESVR